MSFVGELIRFLKVRKKFWLVPIIIMLSLLGALILFAKGSAVAPFKYLGAIGFFESLNVVVKNLTEKTICFNF